MRTALLAVPAAVVATVVVAALARAGGVDLAVAGEEIPLSGVGFVTAVCALVGVALALACRRWSDRPARLFVGTALALTALSLVPPLLADATGSIVAVLVGLHLVAAAIVVPPLGAGLSRR